MSAIHVMELPQKVVVGREVLSGVGKTCRSLGFSGDILLLSGPRTCGVAGKAVADSLESEGYAVDRLIVKEATIGSVEAAEAKIDEVRPTLLVAVGGGKVIDVAKYAAARRQLPYISVPTAASHDGISSPQASIKDSRSKTPYSVRARTPSAIVADLAVIADSPYRLTASGCGDVLAKYTAVRDWWLAHHIKGEYYGEYAASLALMGAKLIAKQADLVKTNTEEGVRVLVEALISCGVAISIAGSSRPCSGSEHLFSHALETVTSTTSLHGEQCGVGTVMMGYLHRIDWKKIKGVLQRIGAPHTAEGLGVEPEQVVEALVKAHAVKPERYTILGERGLNPQTARRLAEVTGVI